jgi:2-polyprenyl-3-methyl-5-hydroxy-6-metoxy-1,4-benzoquinol methylase
MSQTDEALKVLTHRYEHSRDIEDPGSAVAKAVRLVGYGKRVLEIGAGTGSITRWLKERNNCSVTAIEIDPDCATLLERWCDEVHRCDLNDRAWTERVVCRGKFDVVVAADVLEHLVDPWRVLREIRCVLTDEGEGGCVVVSLPHAAHNAVVAALLGGNFEYRENGLLDSAHIRFFAVDNVQHLFDGAGFRIDEAEFVVCHPLATELAHHWRHLPWSQRRAVSANRYGDVFQFVIMATTDERQGPGMKLRSLPVPTSKFPLRDRLRAWCAANLSREHKETIKRLLGRGRA